MASVSTLKQLHLCMMCSLMKYANVTYSWHTLSLIAEKMPPRKHQAITGSLMISEYKPVITLPIKLEAITVPTPGDDQTKTFFLEKQKPFMGMSEGLSSKHRHWRRVSHKLQAWTRGSGRKGQRAS